MKRILFLLLLTTLLRVAPAALAEVVLPSVFGDHMVLQRDVPVRIWGKASPGEEVSVQLVPEGDGVKDGSLAAATADKDGNWQATIKGMPAGKSWKLRISSAQSEKRYEFGDVVFGEVWVASGQSNMEWVVANSDNASEEIANSANNDIRMWTAQRTVKAQPAFDVPGGWAVASPQTTGDFSAVAYFFARQLQKELGVPVGVLHSSWGGTPVESWTSRGALEQIDWARPILERIDTAAKDYDERLAQFNAAVKRWEDTRNGPANTGFEAGYAKSDFDDSTWKTMKLPRNWESVGLDKDGVVWFRKTIDLPDGWAGQKLKLELGPIDDGDTTYLNNTQIGQTEPYLNGVWQRDRTYDVPAELVTQGKLTIAVRVVDLSGNGGIYGKPEQLKLTRADGQGEAISLAGDWRYVFAHEINSDNRPVRPPARPFGPDHPHAAAGLFNGMIAPITPYTVKGTIWYQGEANAWRAQQYRKLFPGLIEDWRKQFSNPDMPFLFVQLANYRATSDKVEDTDWPHLRDAQLHTLRTVKNTGMAVTIDIGAANDIHPRNKQDVGLRLARWALHDTYGKTDVVKSGPILKGADGDPANKQHALLTFETFGSGLKVRGEGPLRGFSVSDGRGNFVHANAQIVESDQGKATVVRVWSDDIKQPYTVRYAWEDNPDEANLVNEEGLPASPFRTDDWKGPTDDRR